MFLTIPIATVLVLWVYFFYQRSRDRERFEFEYRMKMQEYDRDRSLQHKEERFSERDERYAPKIMEEVLYRISRIEDEISERLSREISGQFSHLLDSILVRPDFIDKPSSIQNSTSNAAEHAQIIREISHALNTPLSQIEAAASVVLSTSEDQSTSRVSLQSIVASVQICKSFLGAYRELAFVSGSSAVWAPHSLSDLLTMACDVYEAQTGNTVEFHADVPEAIPGYSNNYIAALLLPLLQNAIESNADYSSVNVFFKRDAEENVIVVVNEPEDDPGGDEIYQSGYSSKEGHDGTGLSSVKTLLNSHYGSSIRHSYNNPYATFTITLPGRGV